MKILFLSNKLPHAGIIGGQRIIYQRMRYLAEAGHQVGLASFISPEGTADQIETVKPFLFELQVFPEPQRNLAVRMLHDYLSPKRPALLWKQYSKKMLKGYFMPLVEFHPDLLFTWI